MPTRKVGGKWYWGSKGPFDSKEKADAVGRAAYAHGYKGESRKSGTSGRKVRGRAGKRGGK